MKWDSLTSEIGMKIRDNFKGELLLRLLFF